MLVCNNRTYITPKTLADLLHHFDNDIWNAIRTTLFLITFSLDCRRGGRKAKAASCAFRSGT